MLRLQMGHDQSDGLRVFFFQKRGQLLRIGIPQPVELARATLLASG